MSKAALTSSSHKSVKELGFSGVATTESGDAVAARGTTAEAAARKARSMSLKKPLAAMLDRGELKATAGMPQFFSRTAEL